MQLPIAVTGMIQGMLLFFLLAADVLIHYRVRQSRAARRRRCAMHETGIVVAILVATLRAATPLMLAASASW